MSVVKINVLTLPAEQREVLEKRFASRAHAVDSSDGFEWVRAPAPTTGALMYHYAAPPLAPNHAAG
ncbi:antibiotic biosynthesis monooxygenase family protein [Streptomyces sp. NPDC001970]